MHLSGFAGSHYGKIQTGLFGFYHNDFTTLPFLPLFQTPTEASELQDSGRPLSSSTWLIKISEGEKSRNANTVWE